MQEYVVLQSEYERHAGAFKAKARAHKAARIENAEDSGRCNA